jgi:hypothetical protein
MFGIWYLVVNNQQNAIKDNAKKVADLRVKIADAERWQKDADKFEAALQETQNKLTEIENTMLPEGGEFLTMSATLREVVKPTKIEFSDLRDPDTKAQFQLLPGFPYRCVVFENTTFFGQYQDFGKLLADLENNYPYWQFQLSAVRPPEGDQPPDEKPPRLRFELKIIALLKPSGQR